MWLEEDEEFIKQAKLILVESLDPEIRLKGLKPEVRLEGLRFS